MSAHLSVRSYYSLLNGTMSPREIVLRAKNENMNAVCLMDKDFLFGALEFFDCAKVAGVKPLFGLEVDAYLDQCRFSMGLIAKNLAGFKALITISKTISEKKELTLSNIEAFQENLVVIVYLENSELESLLIQEDHEGMTSQLDHFKLLFNNLYIGISHGESNFFKRLNELMIQSATLAGIACVATHKVYYGDSENADAFRALQAIDKQTFVDDKTLASSPNRNFISLKELQLLYNESLLRNIDSIVDQCTVDLDELKTYLPHFESGQDVDNAIYLRTLSHIGLKKRLQNKVSSTYQKRLDYELDVITSMNFTDYFLIVYDIIRFAKKEGIYVGPGRGSAAGSLVAYALGIVEVDPIQYGLLFERFLNPQRISMPDIDIDFPDDRRQDVVDYAKTRYGTDHVAHIVTFNTMKAKQAFRDICRVLQIPNAMADRAAKLIQHSSLEQNYKELKRFREFIESDDRLIKAYSLSLQIEGLPRHHSLHAAGIVLSDKPLIEVCPVLMLDEETTVIQYDMTRIEKIGLIKIDFLGLRNLSIIDAIAHEIREIDPSFNIMKIPLDNLETFDLIARGETTGIFQLESEGMKSLLKRMKPTQFMDIVDTIALYRPGPMENIPLYLKNRAHPDSVEYLHQDLKRITESTYGVLIYQEQIMKVSQDMAGFSLARADILRKAMSKKNAQELESLRREFIEGCCMKGYTEKLSVEVFNLIERFANYGFNKSHSVAYALIAYQLAYLKTRYPHRFYANLLTSVIGSEGKTRDYIAEAQRRKIRILPVDIFQSSLVYRIENDAIRMPLTLIKGISKATATLIMNEKLSTTTHDFYDCISAMALVGLKRNQLEALIKSGALDATGVRRESQLLSLDEAIQYSQIIRVKQKDGTVVLNHSLISKPVIVEGDRNDKKTLENELAVMGFYVSDHPTKSLKQKHPVDDISHVNVGARNIRLIVMIEKVKHHRTKNGKLMAFITVSDDTGTLDCVLFPNIYDKIKTNLEIGARVLVKGEMRDQGSLIVQDIYHFDV